LKKKTTDEFISEARRVHGDKFHYHNTVYKDARSKLIVTCKEHGDFIQQAGSHLVGYGCRKCADRMNGIRCRSSTSEFITKAEKVHGDRYDYSKVEYNTAQSSVVIICKEHGEFSQTPNNHLKGENCPKCGASLGEQAIMDWLGGRGVRYGFNHIFPDCSYKGLLRFDFYLPDYAMCIEYDGEHHFRQIAGGSSLELIQARDRVKDKYCMDNNMQMVRIRYDENVEDVLINHLTKIM
jgi:hypothetical protein